MNDIAVNFQKDLDAHDWLFMMVEGPAYLHGRANEERLAGLASRDPVLMEMWRQACKKRAVALNRALNHATAVCQCGHTLAEHFHGCRYCDDCDEMREVK